MMMTDSQHYAKQVEALALASLAAGQSAKAKAYIHLIVQDWLRQAAEDPSLERETIVEIGLADLQKGLAGKVGSARLAALRFHALKPQVQQASARAFSLAAQVVDRKAARQDAAQEAAGLQERILHLMQEVKQLKDEDDRRLLMRELADADLEVRYLLEDEEGAVSLRLNRYMQRSK